MRNESWKHQTSNKNPIIRKKKFLRLHEVVFDLCEKGLRIQDFIRHIHNYTEYNEQWNVSQVRSMDSAIICNKHNRIYVNIGMKKKNKMCNKIKCAGQYTVDLINNNIII